MAGNLVSQILQSIKPEIVARMASSLGLKAADVQQALAGGIPAILAALAGLAAQPDGARRIVDAISQLADTNPLKAAGTRNQQAVADKGRGVLSSLLGGTSLNSLTAAIGNFSGVGENKASSLIGLIAPLVMNGIKRQAGGLDGSKIANLLLSQKDAISAALPPGLSSMLSGSEVPSSLRTATSSAPAQASRTVHASPVPARSQMIWLAWIIPVIAILGALWYFLEYQKGSQPTTPTAQTTAPAPTAETADPSAQVTAAIDSLKTSLQGITDSASAKAALPKLQEADGQLSTVNNLVAKLSPEQKKAVAALIVAAMPTLNGLFDKVLAIPGVADIAKPVIDGLKAKLDVLSKL